MTAMPQHMQALAYANEKRVGAASFKRSVRILRPTDAAERVADTIEGDYADDVIGSIRINSILMAIQRFGMTKTTKCLTVAGVPNFEKRIRDLTPRQRRATAAQLRLWAAGYGTHRP